MAYRTEKVSPTPTLKAIVDNVRNFDDIDRLPCPYCNGQMLIVDNGNYPHEKYVGGLYERTEKFYCDNCGTWADITQDYKPDSRYMKVMRDVYDKEA